jgi:hypothetical protein
VKTLILSSIALLTAVSGLNGQDKQGELKKLYNEKVSEAWFENGGWTADFSAAKARAKKENKFLFTYFTRSYSP